MGSNRLLGMAFVAGLFSCLVFFWQWIVLTMVLICLALNWVSKHELHELGIDQWKAPTRNLNAPYQQSLKLGALDVGCY